MTSKTKHTFGMVREQGKTIKRFQLSLKKHNTLQHAGKENDNTAVNKNLNTRETPNSETFETDPTMYGSQAFKLRMSDSMDTDSGDGKLSNVGAGRETSRENNKFKSTKVEDDSIVLISDTSSNSAGTPMSSGRRKLYTSSLVRRSIGKRTKSPVHTILLDSSDSCEDLPTFDKARKSIISLNSDYESPFDRLKNVNYKPRLTDDISFTSDESSRCNNAEKNKSNSSSSTHFSSSLQPISFDKDSKVATNDYGTTRTAREINGSNNSSGSSSMRFSPSLTEGECSEPRSRCRNTSGSSSSGVNSYRKTVSYDYESLMTPPPHRLNLKTLSHKINENKERTPIVATARNYDSPKLTTSMKKLTRENATTILKAIKSTSIPYYTPNTVQNKTAHDSYKSTSQSSHSEGTNSEVSKTDFRIDDRKALIIDESESESDSDDEIINGSQLDLRPSKTHVSRFLDAPQETVQPNLSEQKKQEISHWIINNSPDSSSSCSHISESNRNSPCHGDSSLERFEMQYETPNNRGKLLKPNTSEKVTSGPNSDPLVRKVAPGQNTTTPSVQKPISGSCINQIVQNVVSRQGTLDRFLHKPKPSISKVHSVNRSNGLKNIRSYRDDHTPKNQLIVRRDASMDDNSKRNQTPAVNVAVSAEAENLSLGDCADILDRVYGKTWRAKADAVLPSSEPRKPNAIKNNRANKTERKVKPSTSNNRSDSGSTLDEFDLFVKNIKPNLNSTRKPSTKYPRRPRDSFIDDRSPSEDSSESMYHTALTNPRKSKDNKPPPRTAPVSITTKRLAIYDSDSDEENDQNNKNKDSNRRRLSFSDSDTSTSEFDPGEIVPPKPKTNKGPAKKPQQSRNVSTIVSKSGLGDDKRLKSFLTSLSATVPMSNCHPDAKIYRTSYKNNKEELCKHLFKLYNKEIFDNKLPRDMSIEWNVRMRGTAGFCYNKKSTKALGGVTRSSRIVLATKILDTPDRLRDTLVHEMCHAAAWLINNVSDGHGPYWKGWASKAMQRYPELPPIKRCHDYKITTKFTYKCTSCGYSIGRHSKSLDVERKRCGHCYGKFELLINRTTKSGTFQTMTPVTLRKTTGFALFVKENYHSVKKTRRSIKHGEVMKILGQQFSAVKIGKENRHAEEL